MHLIFCLNCDYCFAVISRKYKKRVQFGILMTITLRIKIITTQMAKFFSLGGYMFKFNNRNTRARCEISSKITIKTLERRQ